MSKSATLKRLYEAAKVGQAHGFYDRHSAANITYKYLIKTGDQPIILEIAEAGSEDTAATVTFTEAPTVTNAGTALSTYCMNRGSIGETTGVVLTETASGNTSAGTVEHTRTVTADVIDFCKDSPRILKAGTYYQIAITNPNAGPNDMEIRLAWTEQT